MLKTSVVQLPQEILYSLGTEILQFEPLEAEKTVFKDFNLHFEIFSNTQYSRSWGLRGTIPDGGDPALPL